MKRMTIVGVCLTAILAMSAVFVASASATAPEFGRCLKKTVAGGAGFSDAGCLKAVTTGAKYEWTTTIVKNKVTSVMTSEKATLESEGGTKISCTKQKSPAFEINGPKTVAGVIGEYTGCKSAAVPCENTANSEEIITKTLEGEIGVEKFGATHAADKLANILLGPGGKSNKGQSLLAEFHCTGLLEVEVKGSILHPITADKMLLESVEKFAATKGEQKPSLFATETCEATNPAGGKDKTGETADCDNHNLISKLKAAGEFEESGQSQTNKNKGEELVEANTVV